MSEWEVHYLPDVENFVRFKSWGGGDDCVGVEFEAFEVSDFGRVEAAGGFCEEVWCYQVERKGATTSMDCVPLEELDNAQPAIRGAIKWDGCSHFYFGDGEGYLHLCGWNEAKKVGALIDHLFQMAWQLYIGPAGKAQFGEDWDFFNE